MKKSLLVIAVSSLLVACGSGSSGNPPIGGLDDLGHPKPYVTASNRTMEQYVSESGKVKGNIMYTATVPSEDAKTFTIAEDVKSITIRGKKIDLTDDNFAYLSDSKNIFHIVINHSNKGKEDGFLAFVGGYPTQQMPQSGSAKYILGEGDYLDVVFGGKDKGVKGELYGYMVKALLSGNTFEGTHTYPYKKEKDMYYESHIMGGFYGKDAAETAGIWSVKISKNDKVVAKDDGLFQGKKE